MIGYASNTGTRRNLDALRCAGWRVLLTPDNPIPREGLLYAIDNGAWKAFKQGTAFDEAPFRRLVDRQGSFADLHSAHASHDFLARIADLTAELAASQERERKLREALKPFAEMADKFALKTNGLPVVEDEDRVTVEYAWAEFRCILRVRDLRLAASALATPEGTPE